MLELPCSLRQQYRDLGAVYMEGSQLARVYPMSHELDVHFAETNFTQSVYETFEAVWLTK
jgi:hypothetical protein